MKRTYICALALLLSTVTLWAQVAAGWAEVEYAVGEDIVIIRDGKPLPFGDVIGLRLAEGDQIQTGKGTFLELGLRPSGGTLKLSENTAFTLSSLSTTTERGFRLIYGRVRAKVDKLASAHSFNVRSDSTVAGVRGTDFGYDVLTTPATGSEAQSPVTRVYCFNGSVIVNAASESPSAQEAVVVKAGKMVSVAQQDGVWVPTIGPISEEVRSFWTQNDFAAVPSKTSKAAAPSGSLSLPTFARVQAGLKMKNSAIFGGIVLVGLGSVLQGVGAYAYSSGDPVLGLNAVAGGAFLSILSLPVLVFGLSSNPVLAEP